MKRRVSNLNDYRAVLNSSGEIVVGAYARAQRRRRLLIAGLGLALIGTALWLFMLLRPAELQPLPAGSRVVVQCVAPACGFRGPVVVPPDANFPLKCPKCGARSVQKVWVCRDCGHEFLPKGGIAELRCERCGSQRIGTAEAPAAGVNGGS
jgi:DNA-directed RNA polymerase subunit RPC12/RpoP